MSIRHFLKLADFTAEELNYMLERAHAIKALVKNGVAYEPFHGKTLLMIFEKASTRTRVSFETGFYQFGGNVINLTSQGSQLGRSESIDRIVWKHLQKTARCPSSTVLRMNTTPCRS